MKKQQSGFTLVEVAIVMVIIGLLLGGVLKGQEVITNARLKNVNNDFSGISAAIYSYQDRYAALPGDDIAADAHTGAATNGDGDGLFDVAFVPAAAGDESSLVWSHLRSAGLIAGDATSVIPPTNAFGGITGISTGDLTGAVNDTNGITGIHVGFSQIEGNMAVILDTQNDDGNGNTGTVRANANIAAAAPLAAGQYNLTNIYSLIFEL